MRQLSGMIRRVQALLQSEGVARDPLGLLSVDEGDRSVEPTLSVGASCWEQEHCCMAQTQDCRKQEDKSSSKPTEVAVSLHRQQIAKISQSNELAVRLQR